MSESTPHKAEMDGMSEAAKRLATYAMLGSRLRDPMREPAPKPCPDCGRTYLSGENVTMTAPTLPTGTRVIWSGCCDCWERRTRPTQPGASS